jgi:hypothetical protein
MEDMLRRMLGERVELQTMLTWGLMACLCRRQPAQKCDPQPCYQYPRRNAWRWQLTIEATNAQLDMDYA